MTQRRENWLFFLLVCLAPSSIFSWIIHPPPKATTDITTAITSAKSDPRSRRTKKTGLYALPDNYQEIGNHLIYDAASSIGASSEQIDIAWKNQRIVVTVHGSSVYLSDPWIDDEDENDGEDPTLVVDNEDEDENHEGGSSTTGNRNGGVDVTALARSINSVFDQNEIGFQIAESYEIEVTTPGASDVLAGDIMFEAYKGFDVITEHQDPKTKSVKQIEGKLVERNDEFTILNIKGRMKKLKNENVLTVKLPKAKKEKNAR
jgi:ribosome maturation factor RimP